MGSVESKNWARTVIWRNRKKSEIKMYGYEGCKMIILIVLDLYDGEMLAQTILGKFISIPGEFGILVWSIENENWMCTVVWRNRMKLRTKMCVNVRFWGGEK